MDDHYPGAGQNPSEATSTIEGLRAELLELKRRERYYRVTLNSIGDAVITTDADGKVALLNPVAEELSGWGREAIGQPVEKVFRIINTKTRKPVESPVACVLREGKILGLANHTSLISKDGREYQIADSGAPIIDDENKVIGAVLVFHDVSQQYAIEEEIRRNERFLDILVENSPHPLWVSDPDGNVIRVNAAVCKVLNLSAEQMIGTYNPLKDPNLEKAGLMPLIHRVFREKEEVRFDLMWDPAVFDEEKFEGGRKRHADVSMYPLTDDDNNLLNVVCQWTDTTEARENVAALRVIYEATENAYNAFDIVGEDGKFIYVNKSYVRMWGYDSAEELIGTSPESHCVDPEIPGRIVGQLRSAGTFESEFEARRKDGSQFTVLMNGGIGRDESGKELYFSSSIDITERRRNRERIGHLNSVLRSLREINQLIARDLTAERLIREVAEILVRNRGFGHVWCALTNEEGRVTDFSQLSSEFPTAEPRPSPEIGKLPQCYESLRNGPGVLFFDSQEHCCSETGKCAESGDSTFGFCGSLRHNGKDYGVLSITTAKVSYIAEEEKSLFGEICMDMGFALSNIEREAERKRIFEEMAEAKAEAERANRAKDEFLAVMSHELRTPLNPILGFTQLLRESASGEDSEMLDTIFSAGRRQLKLIEQILDYTRLDRSNVVVASEPYPLLKLCRTAFEDLRPNNSRISYYFENGNRELDPIPEDLEVVGDGDMLIRILENLLENAGKYTKKGSITFTVGEFPSSTNDQSEFRFLVRDTGIGMDASLREKIFQAFTQGDSSYSRVQGGVGLGLAICSKLIEVLKGRIELESSPGEGSCFTVCLPMPISKVPGNEELGDIHGEQRRLSGPLKILVVEDDAGNRMYVERLIEQFGAGVTVVSTGKQAFELCSAEPFDVILMDIHMPEMNGFETTEAIRKEGRNRETTIFALTADLTESNRDRCSQVGMVEFVPKPVSPEDLFRKLETLAQR